MGTSTHEKPCFGSGKPAMSTFAHSFTPSFLVAGLFIHSTNSFTTSFHSFPQAHTTLNIVGGGSSSANAVPSSSNSSSRRGALSRTRCWQGGLAAETRRTRLVSHMLIVHRSTTLVSYILIVHRSTALVSYMLIVYRSSIARAPRVLEWLRNAEMLFRARANPPSKTKSSVRR